MMNEQVINEARDLIAGFIVSRRKKLGLTQAQLAEKAGLGIATIKRIESKKFIPDGKSLIKLTLALGCYDEFMKFFRNTP